MTPRTIAPLALLVGLALLAGCGPSSVKLYPVTGKVLVNKQVPEHATVVFHPVGNSTLDAPKPRGTVPLYRNGKLILTASGNNRVNGGGWCRPASELNLLRGSSADGATIPGPAGINATNGEVLGTYPHPFYNVDGTGQIYGFHSGGVNSLFADGSVRFLKQSISIRTLAALVTRNGGEVLAGDY